MNLIDRYVNDIGRRLPRRQRADVRKELRSALYDALESRSGGEPTEEDVVALLKEFGRPEEVAASYRPSDQYLIGPELYPLFKQVLGIVLAVVSSVFVLIFAITLFFRPAEAAVLGGRLLGLVNGVFWTLWTSAGTIVLVFAALQRLEVRPDEPEEDWNPRDLPAVRDIELVGRWEAVAGIVFPAIFLSLLVLFRDRIGLVMSPGQEPLLNHVLRENLPWISVALLLGMGLHTLLLWQRRWHWPTRLANFAIDLFTVYVLYRIAIDIAAEKATLDAAGLPGPLPVMIVRLAWSIVAIVGIMVVVDAAKVLYGTLIGRSR